MSDKISDEKPLSEYWQAKRNASAALYQLIETLVTSQSSATELNELAELVKQQTASLEKNERLYGRTAFIKKGEFGDQFYVSNELGPINGKSNPIAPPISIWFEGDRALGSAEMGWQYEGPEGSVHGGLIAAVFDHFVSVAQKLTGQPGVTGTLTVKYLQRTPLKTELRLVGWVDRVEGRKNFMVAELWAGEVKTAECECILISMAAAT